MTIANRSFAQSFFPCAFQRPALQAALVVLLVLECLPIWTFQYFPSEDGPSHLYNASVLAHYRAEPLYQQYYRIAPTFAGNMLTDFILVFLLKLTQPLVAEKLLLSSYMVLSFISFRYLLRGLTPYADYFSLFAGVLFSNWFMYVGLWNFCFIVPLSLF